MSGTQPKFMENIPLHPDYFEVPNPYINAPSCYIDLRKMSNYAKQSGKKLTDLTAEEIRKFSL